MTTIITVAVAVYITKLIGRARRQRREMSTGFWWENQKDRDHYEALSLGWRIILKWIIQIGWSCMDWIHLGQDGEQWRVLVNTVMNLRVPRHFGNFSSS
jgi:hypothetical protein